MAGRSISNPLGLAVLSLLTEKPMHPYEMSNTLRYRQKEASIKLNYGSLYSVVELLAKHELIEVHDVLREGGRPERTVYAITDAGRERHISWLSELVAVPKKEYPQFEAALSLIPGLPPDEVLRLLRVRLSRLSSTYASTHAVIEDLSKQGLPRLFDLEGEYANAVLAAEIDFVRGLITELADGTFENLALWHRLHTGTPLAPADWKEAGIDYDRLWQ